MKTAIELCLERIRDRYGEFIAASATSFGHRPEVLAGIMMRETEGGESRYLDVPGPEGRGDGGHGHGLMQIDDRSFPAFCASRDWKVPSKNIEFGARVLGDKQRFLSGAGISEDVIERAAIAAYNCGEGNILKAWRAGEDLDSRTANHDYSRCVLQYAETYAGLSVPVVIEEATMPPPAQSTGFFAVLLQFFLKVFGRKKP